MRQRIYHEGVPAEDGRRMANGVEISAIYSLNDHIRIEADAFAVSTGLTPTNRRQVTCRTSRKRTCIITMENREENG